MAQRSSHSTARHAVIRLVEGIDGQADLDVEFRPVVDFARGVARLDLIDDVVHTNAGADLRSTIPFTVDGDRARARVTVRKGERHLIVIGRYAGRAFDRADELLRVTRAFWTEWSDYCRYERSVSRSRSPQRAGTQTPDVRSENRTASAGSVRHANR